MHLYLVSTLPTPQLELNSIVHTEALNSTHQGLYDIAMLRPIPNMTLMMPRNALEAYQLLYTAYQEEGPFAIRYPRGDVLNLTPQYEQWNSIPIGVWEELKPGKDAYLISIGPVLDEFVKLAEDLQIEGIELGIVNGRFIKPLDTKMLDELAALEVPIFVYEEATLIAGLGSAIIEYYNEMNQQVLVKRFGVPDLYVQHGSVGQLLEELRLTVEDVKKEIKQILKK